MLRRIAVAVAIALAGGSDAGPVAAETPERVHYTAAPGPDADLLGRL